MYVGLDLTKSTQLTQYTLSFEYKDEHNSLVLLLSPPNQSNPIVLPTDVESQLYNDAATYLSLNSAVGNHQSQ
jgi:hypothetical protein